mgnify:CR=1 FL=1
MAKIALITGVTGQDGSYLAEFLLKKKYIVHGIKRKSSSFNTERIDYIINNKIYKSKFFLHYGDLTDSDSLIKLINKIKPNEIYNLGAQSHVGVSFENPVYTAEVTGLGSLRILEAIRFLKLKNIKFYQATSSELFGEKTRNKFNENSEFNPKSPYGVSKLFSHHITKVYRESYGIFACSGILFNHESPRRGETFVTKKIISAMCRIKFGKQKKLFLGNLYAKRDWGHAKDYCLAMWKILQYKKPDDFIIATGKQYSIKQFINLVAKKLKMQITWKGKGLNEKGYNNKKEPIIECDKNYFRPLDVNTLLGDSSKAKKLLKWKPKINIKMLIDEMIEFELKNISK